MPTPPPDKPSSSPTLVHVREDDGNAVGPAPEGNQKTQTGETPTAENNGPHTLSEALPILFRGLRGQEPIRIWHPAEICKCGHPAARHNAITPPRSTCVIQHCGPCTLCDCTWFMLSRPNA